MLINTLYPKPVWMGYSRGLRFGPVTSSSPFLNINYGRSDTDLGAAGWSPWDTKQPNITANNQSFCAALTGTNGGSMIMDDLCSDMLGTLCLAPSKANSFE